jgi:hypothetical protein
MGRAPPARIPPEAIEKFEAYLRNKKKPKEKYPTEWMDEERRWYRAYYHLQWRKRPAYSFRKILMGAESRNIPVDMSRQHVIEQVFESECYYCGTIRGRFLLGLDRVDNSKGYTDENTVCCCLPCNFGKNKFTATEYIDRCDLIATLAGWLKPPESIDMYPTVRAHRAQRTSRMWAGFLAGARKRNLAVEITKWQWSHLIDMPCHYCHIEEANGLDRVKSHKPCTMANIVPCCAACNCTKGVQPIRAFYKRCARVAARHKQRPRIYQQDMFFAFKHDGGVYAKLLTKKPPWPPKDKKPQKPLRDKKVQKKRLLCMEQNNWSIEEFYGE